MSAFLKNLFKKHKFHFKNRWFVSSFAWATILLFASIIINFYAGQYATERASNYVTDIVLNNIPVFDVDAIFIYGSILFSAFVALLCIVEPKRIPFVFKSIALFVIIRSVFISLTHLGPFPDQILISGSRIISKFSFGGDLFFSGHTGFPYLMALIFWESIYLRILFIILSIIFGATVLMGHLHYSIDVLSAFFITYTIFHIAKKIFKKDYKLLHDNPADLQNTAGF